MSVLRFGTFFGGGKKTGLHITLKHMDDITKPENSLTLLPQIYI